MRNVLRTLKAEENKPTIVRELVDLFRPYPKLQLTGGDMATYARFRCLEPALVSYLDEHGNSRTRRLLEALVLHWQDQAAGAVSFIVEVNRYRSDAAKKFARIDLVMVDESCRGLGFGRLLIHCVTTHLLRAHGRMLYSISCLAAHATVEKALRGLAFIGRPEKERDFRHMELKLDAVSRNVLPQQMAARTAALLKAVSFRMRQRENTSFR